MEKIDFVIPWVDGGDPEWVKEKAKYSGMVLHGNEVERFRDWETLIYWFRGVEKFAPWVNKVHFITWGHIPAWLNTEHPKLHIVKHEDYIPKEYLPIFSSHPIELNLHRIEGLSEHFVYFNDDFFLVNHVCPEDFFRNGLPCSTAGLSIPMQVPHQFAGILYRDYGVINKNFSSRAVLKKYIWKFIHPSYGLKRNFQSLLLLPYCTSCFPGLYNAHGPNPYLKSTFHEVWERNKGFLHETCLHRFRSFDDVNQYVFLWWQWCKGQFFPRNTSRFVTYLTVRSPDVALSNSIMLPQTPVLVINDDWVDDFERKKAVVIGAFEKLLPKKSSFEL